MKNFKEYLSESKKQYSFRVKVAGNFSSEQEQKMKTCLERYSVGGFKKVGKTPIQTLPLDFPQVKNCEVNIFEVTLDYPTTPFELTEFLSSELKIGKQNLVVRNPNEPGEMYQAPVEKREGALLNDSEYKEAENHKFEDFYGDKYNSQFVKELNNLLKLERKARGEQIPESETVKYNTDSEPNTKSVLKLADDPRK
jgi:hypothetical protein